ncbi:MAG: pyridoxal phosphate-dependent aminotransferase [Chloroflexota bacterium]|nr:pyridoxal phosphate-dependent aminotransferase [Chloroflexota bacterium]
MYLSQRVLTTAAPIIADLGELAAACRAAGQDVINLGQGVSGFPPPAAALAAARAALTDPATHVYGPEPGVPVLGHAIARKWLRDAGVTLDPDTEIIVTAGANQAAALAVLACTDWGDDVLLPSPYYFNSAMLAHLTGLHAIEAPLAAADGFALRWECLAPHLTPRTRAALLTTPGNPTGAVADPAELARCIRELVARGITPIVDETYEYFVFDSARHWSPAADPDLRPHIVTVGSFSKSFGLAGWRVGYLFGPPDLVRQALKVQDTLVICAPVISQIAVAAALDSDYYPALAAQRAELAARRAALRAGLATIPALTWAETHGSLFAFLRVAGDPPAAALARRLITEAGVQLIPGSAFGHAGAGHLRLSYGAASVAEIAAALGRLSLFFYSM